MLSSKNAIITEHPPFTSLNKWTNDLWGMSVILTCSATKNSVNSTTEQKGHLEMLQMKCKSFFVSLTSCAVFMFRGAISLFHFCNWDECILCRCCFLTNVQQPFLQTPWQHWRKVWSWTERCTWDSKRATKSSFLNFKSAVRRRVFTKSSSIGWSEKGACDKNQKIKGKRYPQSALGDLTWYRRIFSYNSMSDFMKAITSVEEANVWKKSLEVVLYNSLCVPNEKDLHPYLKSWNCDKVWWCKIKQRN